MRLARGTVRNGALRLELSRSAVGRPSCGIIDPHLPHLRGRVAEGREDAAALWQELRARDFAGTAKQVRRWLGERRREPAKTVSHRWRGSPTVDPGSADAGSPVPLSTSR